MINLAHGWDKWQEILNYLTTHKTTFSKIILSDGLVVLYRRKLQVKVTHLTDSLTSSQKFQVSTVHHCYKSLLLNNKCTQL